MSKDDMQTDRNPEDSKAVNSLDKPGITEPLPESTRPRKDGPGGDGE